MKWWAHLGLCLQERKQGVSQVITHVSVKLELRSLLWSKLNSAMRTYTGGICPVEEIREVIVTLSWRMSCLWKEVQFLQKQNPSFSLLPSLISSPFLPTSSSFSSPPSLSFSPPFFFLSIFPFSPYTSVLLCLLPSFYSPLPVLFSSSPPSFLSFLQRLYLSQLISQTGSMSLFWRSLGSESRFWKQPMCKLMSPIYT